MPQREVPRPSLPVLAWAIIALAVGLGGSAQAIVAWRSSGSAQLLWALGGTAAALAAIGAWAARKARLTSVFAAAFVCGAVVGAAYWTHIAQESASLRGCGSRWEVTATSDATAGKFGSASVVRVVSGPAAGALLQATWPDGTAPRLGQSAEVYGSASTSEVGPAAVESFERGVCGTLGVRRVETVHWGGGVFGAIARARSWAATRIRATGGVGAELLASSLLGDVSGMSGTQADSDLKIAGLAHFEAASGFHLVVISAVLEAALAGIGLVRRWRNVLAAAILGTFVLFTGLRTSVARAWLMALIGRAGWQVGRRADPLSALALCAGVFLCVSPNALFDVSFQISVIAVAGIVVFATLCEAWIEAIMPVRIRAISAPVAVTLCAVIATLPVTAPVFGCASLVAPVTNVLAVPLVTASLLTGVAGVCLSIVPGPAGPVVLAVASAFSAMLVALAHWFAGLPGAAVPVSSSPGVGLGLLAALGAIWVAWPQPRRWVALGLVTIALAAWMLPATAPAGAQSPRVVVLDVGQGDAILVADKRTAMLVDTGPTDAAVLAALGRQGVHSVSAVVVTHLHVDHYGGLAGVEHVLHPSPVFFPLGTLSEKSRAVATVERDAGAARLEELGAGDRLRVGTIELDVISPRDPVVNAATNEASIVMVAREGSESVLLTGDAEAPVVEPALAARPIGHVDVLKVGHHGSAISMSPTLLRELGCSTAVISVGVGNRYGHPTPTALRLLREAGITTYRTDLDGDVAIEFAPGAVCVHAARGGTVHVAEARRACRESPAFSVACERLGRALERASSDMEHDGCQPCRPETDVPDLRVRGPPPRPGRGTAEASVG